MATQPDLNSNNGWIVSSQARTEWPSKDYSFTREGEARMFLAMCKRDGDHRCSIRRGQVSA